MCILVFVVIGAALSVFIAWGCALLSSPSQAAGLDPLLLAPLRREFFERHGPDPGGSDPGTLFVAAAHDCFGAQFFDVKVEDRDLPSDEFTGPLPYIAYVRSGWPWLALEAEWHHDASRSPTPLPVRTRWGLSFDDRYVRGDRLFMPRTIPLRPMWPGLAVNLAFWTLIASLAWFVPRMMRRMTRRWRGRCPYCAYPVGVSAVCSECGRDPGRRSRPAMHLPRSAKLSA